MKIQSISVLRGVAILMVVYQHVISTKLVQHFNCKILIADFWIGVNLFFILSGFVLYLPYLKGNRQINTIKDIKIFYLARFKRLYPLFLISVLVSIIFVYGININTLESGLLSLTTLSMVTEDNFFPLINGVLWSLIVEIWFSILFPFLILIKKKKSLTIAYVSCFISSLLIRLIGTIYEWDVNMHLNPIKDIIFGRIDDFLLGMIIAEVYIFNFEKVKINFFHLLFGICFLALGSLIYDLKISYGYSSLKYLIPITNNLFQMGFGLIILFFLKQDHTVFKFITRNYVLQLIGMMSYSIYIWHPMLQFKYFGNPMMSNYLYNLVIYFVFLFIFSFLSYRFIECGNESDIKKVLPR